MAKSQGGSKLADPDAAGKLPDLVNTKKSDWGKLQCMELLLVAGKSNKEVAELLGITEQQVANYKSEFIERTRSLLGRLPLDSEVFPELFSS